MIKQSQRIVHILLYYHSVCVETISTMHYYKKHVVIEQWRYLL